MVRALFLTATTMAAADLDPRGVPRVQQGREGAPLDARLGLALGEGFVPTPRQAEDAASEPAWRWPLGPLLRTGTPQPVVLPTPRGERTAEALGAVLLRGLSEQSTLGRNVVLVHPDWVGTRGRQALNRSAGLAGLKVKRTIPASAAAALSLSRHAPEGNGLAVVPDEGRLFMSIVKWSEGVIEEGATVASDLGSGPCRAAVRGALASTEWNADLPFGAVLVASRRSPAIVDALGTLGPLKFEPDAVALGGAIKAGILEGTIPDLLFLRALRESVLGSMGDSMLTLLKANTVIPHQRTVALALRPGAVPIVERLGGSDLPLGVLRLPPAPSPWTLTAAADVDAALTLKAVSGPARVEMVLNSIGDDAVVTNSAYRRLEREAGGGSDAGDGGRPDSPERVTRGAPAEDPKRPLAGVAPRADAAASRPLQVFLCHSSRDKARVVEYHGRLKADGFQPWLDKEDLLAGQDWRVEIPKAIRRSHAVVVFLSATAVTRAGFLQKEIRHALEVADEQPEGSIFIVPVRLEPCEVPESLQRLHWVDLHEPEGYARLVRALRAREAEMRRRAAP